MKDKFLKLTTYDGRFDRLLNVKLPKLDIIQSQGLKTHILKRHSSCVKYLDKINEIISSPDYVGVNPKESNSFELIKKYADNVLIGIKLDIKNNYYYVATLHDINQSKLERRIHSGRVKACNKG